MRKLYLLSSVLLAAPFMMNGEARAADCVTQDCPTLGYTSTSNSGNCVKCPFGNYWACPKTESCSSAYQYTCTGANQVKPSTGSCGGKYTSCNCSSGYEWKSGTCSKALPKCQIGYIYYTDNTCSYNLDNSKTVKGVVVYAKSGGGGYAVDTYIGPTNINSHLMETVYYDSLPQMTLTEAKTDFTSRALGIPAGVAQSIIDNATDIGYALMKAGVNFNNSNSTWHNIIATSTAVNSTMTSGDKTIWSFRFSPTSWDVNGTVSGFETAPLSPMPIEYFDKTSINVWKSFEF